MRLYKCWYNPFIVAYSANDKSLASRKKESYSGHPNQQMALCYATSTDGIVWDKPYLNVHSFDGNNNNNIVLKGNHGSGVFKDETEKDPRLVQLIIDESTKVVRKKQGVVIVRHKLGHVGANAGIDQSNIEHSTEGSALLLPVAPDKSARQLKDFFRERCGISIGVVISDSMNRPWRLGTVGEAIGCSGLNVLDDRRGETDMYGRELKITLINQADALASIATLVMGETSEATPVVLIKGLNQKMNSHQTAGDIIRPLEDDLFCD